MNLIRKLKHKLRGEQCPRCKSYKVISGTGFAGLTCSICKEKWDIIGFGALPDAPQANGKQTLYEEYVCRNKTY